MPLAERVAKREHGYKTSGIYGVIVMYAAEVHNGNALVYNVTHRE